MNPKWNDIDGYKVRVEDIEQWHELPVTKLLYRLLEGYKARAEEKRDHVETPNDQVNFYRGECVGLTRIVGIESYAIDRLLKEMKQQEEGKTNV